MCLLLFIQKIYRISIRARRNSWEKFKTDYDNQFYIYPPTRIGGVIKFNEEDVNKLKVINLKQRTEN